MARDVMHAFFELIGHGFTTFDCGDIYTGGEEFLGTLVARLKHGEGPVSADDIQIHTKYVPDLDILANVTFKHTESIIDRSLRRLNRDTLDLVQFHWWDYNVPGYVEVALDLLKLKEKGKIRNIGVSHIATKYILGRPSVACAIVGMRNSRHVADNCKIFGFELSPEDDAAITAFLDEYPRLQGDCYTLERESPRYKSIIHMNVNEEEQGGNDALTSE